jgi:CarD family transcriptional regulator
VYPNHGAAVIENIEMRTIKGLERQYLVLRIVAQQDLVVRVPACNLDLVGVRDVVDKEGLDRVFDVLRAAHVEEPTNWSRRYKANLEKLHSGDVMKVSEVVRDLWRRERDRGLSAGEKRMLAKARQILVSELALAEHTNEDKAGLDRVFDVLRAAHVEEPTNWSRRYKANLEKLHSGDVMKVSEVVRDLWRRERDRGLSAGEKRMLAKARQILVSELALAEHTNEDKAETILDEVLAS